MLSVQERLKLVTVLGAGLLCGTALAVIIPEGVHALYEEILEGTSSVSQVYLCPLIVLPAPLEEGSIACHYAETKSVIGIYITKDCR